MIPLEDLLSFAVWVLGFFGNRIVWRGRRYYLYPDGRFLPEGPCGHEQDGDRADRGGY